MPRAIAQASRSNSIERASSRPERACADDSRQLGFGQVGASVAGPVRVIADRGRRGARGAAYFIRLHTTLLLSLPVVCVVGAGSL
jgi:hypothetical protein